MDIIINLVIFIENLLKVYTEESTLSPLWIELNKQKLSKSNT